MNRNVNKSKMSERKRKKEKNKNKNPKIESLMLYYYDIKIIFFPCEALEFILDMGLLGHMVSMHN